MAATSPLKCAAFTIFQHKCYYASHKFHYCYADDDYSCFFTPQLLQLYLILLLDKQMTSAVPHNVTIAIVIKACVSVPAPISIADAISFDASCHNCYSNSHQ